MKAIVVSLNLLIMVCMMSSCNNTKEKKAGFSGKDISGKAWITSDPATNQLYFVSTIEGDQWKLYQGDSPDAINFTYPILQGEGKREYLISNDNTQRTYFELITTHSSAILAERHLPLQGSYNFRDLGGIRNKNGKYTKWGKVFRSDDLPQLTASDLIYLSSIPIISVIDFRSPTEIKKAPDHAMPTVRNQYKLSISPGNLADLEPDDMISFTERQGDSIMREINRELVTTPEAIRQYQEFFRILQDENNLPLVFHCTAGKDRTGVAAFLYLSSLNVEVDVIMNDYLASNDYLKDKYGKYIQEYPFLKPLMEVRKEYLQTAIDEINRRYGSIETYLTDVLMVDLPKMKKMYLYE